MFPQKGAQTAVLWVTAKNQIAGCLFFILKKTNYNKQMSDHIDLSYVLTNQKADCCF